MKSLKSTPAWKWSKRILIDPLRRVGFETLHRGSVPLSYCDDDNWGDALSPVLVGMLSGLPVTKILWHHQHRYLAIGSILGNAGGRAEVWGSGFLWENETLQEPPQAVHAVRGPRSRAKLLEQGIDCPEIYGDPALLFPRFFNPQVEKKYEIGIIPHYSDKGHPWLERCRQDPRVRMIDVEGGINQFVEAVKSCEMILSSSLHGLICSDAYGVPNLWIELSDKVYGGSFKFCDYYESVGRGEAIPVRPDENMQLSKVIGGYQPHVVQIDLRPLISACPFIADDVRRKLLETSGC